MGAKNVFSLLASLDVTCCILPIVPYIHTNIRLTTVWLYYTYSMVQHIEWDCEARLALVDTSSGFSRCITHLKKIPLLRKHPWNRSQNRSYHLLKQNKDWTWHTTGPQHFHAKRLMFIHLGKWTRLLVCSTCRVEHRLEGQHCHSTNHSERITCPKGRLAWLPAKATTCNYIPIQSNTKVRS